jgi:hypothetical protein
MLNCLMYARGRPHSLQRLYFLTPNFGVRLDFTISDVLAKLRISLSCACGARSPRCRRTAPTKWAAH